MRNILKCFLLLIVFTGCSLEKDKEPEVVIQKENPQKLIDDLFKAVLTNDVESVNALVQNERTDLNAYDEEGFTALMRAVQMSSNPFTVGALIKSGAKIYKPSKDDQNLSAFAIETQNAEVRRLLDVESKRLSDELLSMVESESFTDATQYVDDNFLPHSLKLNEDGDTALKVALSVISKPSDDGVGFISEQLQKYVTAGDDLMFVYRISMDACLLYTSPSPRDQRGSRMPSSA